MRIALLSTDGREDIVEGFVKFSERFWPDRPWPIEAIVGHPEGSYSQRIISYLKSIPEEVLMLAIDDHWPYPAVDQKAIDRAYDYILSKKSVGAIHLLNCTSTSPSCAELPGFKFIGIHDSDRGCEGAFLARKEYMLEVTEKIGSGLNQAQDAGIVGMTNWELGASRVGAAWDILCPEPTISVFQRLNAVAEAQWRDTTIELVQKLGIGLNLSKRKLWDGKAPHWDMWNAAR